MVDQEIKQRQRIFVFGNPRVKEDALPLRILPKLKKRFPQLDFVVADPTEILNYNKDILILDTAEGLRDVILFNDLSQFIRSPRVSVHDYDTVLDLGLLKKIGKLEKVQVIGIPKAMTETEAANKVSYLLERFNSS